MLYHNLHDLLTIFATHTHYPTCRHRNVPFIPLRTKITLFYMSVIICRLLICFQKKVIENLLHFHFCPLQRGLLKETLISYRQKVSVLWSVHFINCPLYRDPYIRNSSRNPSVPSMSVHFMAVPALQSVRLIESRLYLMGDDKDLASYQL